jgi:hypothetical protein
MKTPFMKTSFSAVLLFAAVAGYAHAQSDVFLCVDDRGNKEYKNTGATKGCKRVELQGITMIPSPYKKPALQTVAARGAMPSADFPKVDGSIQKARDNDRRQILLDEMKSEEQRLANLKKEFNNGEPERRGDEKNFAKYQERVAIMKEDIVRSENNVEALKREINNLK